MTNTTSTSPAERNACLDGPIHLWFELTYSNYLVLHRTLMQSMPAAWQERAVTLFGELDAAFADVERAPAYIVTPAEEREYGDLSEAERMQLGISHSTDGSTIELAGDVYFDRDGEEHTSDDTVLVPIADDPAPHYNRGRTFIESAAISWPAS